MELPDIEQVPESPTSFSSTKKQLEPEDSLEEARKSRDLCLKNGISVAEDVQDPKVWVAAWQDHLQKKLQAQQSLNSEDMLTEEGQTAKKACVARNIKAMGDGRCSDSWTRALVTAAKNTKDELGRIEVKGDSKYAVSWIDTWKEVQQNSQEPL